MAALEGGAFRSFNLLEDGGTPSAKRTQGSMQAAGESQSSKAI